MADTYQEVKIIHFDNMVVRVHAPILTPEERERRLEAIKRAAVDLVIDTERKKQR